jgi:hypothetical protein
MLNIEQIKNCPLTSQEIYDMINSCLEEAEDNGFLNQFVFERALVCHEVLLLIEDLDDIDGPMVAENPLTAFDHFLEMGYIQNLIKNHTATVDYIGKVAAQYFEDYEKYLLSIGGVLNKAEIFSSEVLQNMAGQMNNLTKNGDIQETLKIANEWGMNRQPAKAENPVDSEKVLDSLFNV